MDPLSIIASSIAVIGVVEEVVRRARELGTATSALHSLSNEIADLTVVLKETDQSIRHHVHGPVVQQDATFIQTIQSIKSRLENIEQQIMLWTVNSGKKLNPVDLRRLNWIHLGSKANKLKDEVRALRLQLITVLNAVAATKTSRIQLDLQEVYLLAENTINGQANLHSKLHTNQTEQLRYLEKISQSVADLRAEATIEITQDSGPDTFRPRQSISPDESGAPRIQTTSIKAFHHNSGVLLESKQMTAISAVGIRTAQFSRMACKPWCNCNCHKEASFRTPSFSEKLLGSLFIGYSGFPRLRPKCNERSCHLESQPLMYITYFFPTWFLARMISLMISITPLAGPVISLKTQRAVSADSDIFVCAKTGNIDRMKYLFENGLASPHDVSISSGITALHYAISYQQIEICTLLLKANADPFLQDRSRWTAADNAWSKILSKRFPPEKENQLRILFSDTEYLERWNFTTLHKIILGLSLNDLKGKLEESTADIDVPDSNGRTPLSFAAERSDLNSLKILLSYGADPSIYSPDQGSPLHFAATATDPSGISILVKHDAEIDCVTSYAQTPLHYAAAYNASANHAKKLLSAGANPNFKDADGMTPLHWTAVSGNFGIAEVLLSRGGDINVIDNQGDSVFSQSIKANRHQMIPLLLRHNPDVKGRLLNGQSILHVIAAEADLETIRLLQASNLVFNSNTMIEDGRTPLDIFNARENIDSELEQAFMLLLGNHTSTSIKDTSDSEDNWVDAEEFL